MTFFEVCLRLRDLSGARTWAPFVACVTRSVWTWCWRRFREARTATSSHTSGSSSAVTSWRPDSSFRRQAGMRLSWLFTCSKSNLCSKTIDQSRFKRLKSNHFQIHPHIDKITFTNDISHKRYVDFKTANFVTYPYGFNDQ